MKPYELSTIYASLKQLVRKWPIEDHMPHTFAVLTSFSDLDTPNLGKTIRDKDRPYFYSRTWADQMYNPSRVRWAVPGVFIFEVEGTLETSSANYITHTLQIAVLDAPEKKDERWVKLQAEERATHQIFEDTENTLIAVLTYLKSLDLGAWSNAFQALFRRDNPQLSFNRWQGGNGDLYGNVITIQISIPCATQAVTLRDLEGEEYQVQDHHKSQDTPEAAELLGTFGDDDMTGFPGGGLQPFQDED